MCYRSTDMARDRCNCYFSFWAIFYAFTPLAARKIKISKKWKRQLEISSFYVTVPKIMIICYTVPEILCLRDVIVIFYFMIFFDLLPSNSPKNQNVKKNENTSWKYHHLTHLCQKLWLEDARFLRYGARRTDGQTDGQTEKVTYRGGCPT